MSRTPSPAAARTRLTICSALLYGAAASIFASGAIAATSKTNDAGEKKILPSKVTFIDSPSGESPAARKKRLKIECKGRPNAGACLGHAR